MEFKRRPTACTGGFKRKMPSSTNDSRNESPFGGESAQQRNHEPEATSAKRRQPTPFPAPLEDIPWDQFTYNPQDVFDTRKSLNGLPPYSTMLGPVAQDKDVSSRPCDDQFQPRLGTSSLVPFIVLCDSDSDSDSEYNQLCFAGLVGTRDTERTEQLEDVGAIDSTSTCTSETKIGDSRKEGQVIDGEEFEQYVTAIDYGLTSNLGGIKYLYTSEDHYQLDPHFLHGPIRDFLDVENSQVNCNHALLDDLKNAFFHGNPPAPAPEYNGRCFRNFLLQTDRKCVDITSLYDFLKNQKSQVDEVQNRLKKIAFQIQCHKNVLDIAVERCKLYGARS